MSSRMLWMGALLPIALSGCAVNKDVAEGPSGAETSRSTARSATSGESSPPPTDSRAPDGIDVAISSHCGVRSAEVKGDLWLASPPLGGHNPPPGWGENETTGSFVIMADGRGMFYGDGGQKARFRLAEPGSADPNDGCE